MEKTGGVDGPCWLVRGCKGDGEGGAQGNTSASVLSG